MMIDVTCNFVVIEALKMQDVQMQEVKMTDQVAARDSAGQNCRT